MRHTVASRTFRNSKGFHNIRARTPDLSSDKIPDNCLASCESIASISSVKGNQGSPRPNPPAKKNLINYVFPQRLLLHYFKSVGCVRFGMKCLFPRKLIFQISVKFEGILISKYPENCKLPKVAALSFGFSSLLLSLSSGRKVASSW